ncbi:TetR/AcrR family transcriptional regulator [Paenibacillus sp. CN-4]|uniref:TetR/AcrR family transcriptional regulator n=1 Tax=Paenibacillus nanchangensis TaxID=3348343 RepID=UPI0039796BD8
MSTPNETLDPRIKRTHQLIRDAFLSLMQEKRFEQITVRDIAARAEINRATFYLHYQDKYELLNQIVEEMLIEFEAIFQLPEGFGVEDFISDPNTPPESFIRQFEHIAENARFYKVMLGPHGLPGFAARLDSIISKSLYHRSIIAEPSDNKMKMPREIIVRYVTAAHLGIIVYWLEMDMNFSPQYMAAQLIRLHSLGSVECVKG